MYKQTEAYKRLKSAAGYLLAKALPRQAESIRKEFTLAFWKNRVDNNVVSRLIRFHLAERAQRLDGGVGLEKLHKNFWANHPSEAWYAETRSRLRNEYLPFFEQHLEQLSTLVERHGVRRICEVGTGTGETLLRLREHFGSRIETYVGIDLSESQIERNRAAHPGIEFVAGDAVEWIRGHTTDHTLYFTLGGVFEYFAQETLEGLFAMLRERTRSSVLALVCEPLEEDFDLEKDLRSRTYGSELSHFHNYPHLLKQAGWTIAFSSIDTVAGQRGITIYAVPAG